MILSYIPHFSYIFFILGSSYECYEPDHDPNIWYAYGECFGRCGGGCCGASGLLCTPDGVGTYTMDCLDHDLCVRFGHSLASWWCDDEFAYTTDDYAFAPNCDVPGYVI
jgi:hypothetical protein